eukprot:GHVH01004495.1.p1 GENE.GHVH01004495.1~~GHVH01004495.1.p1  ORF type:complete len:242 (+),score=16.07 GHVH01004495.1:290-1015(+)
MGNACMTISEVPEFYTERYGPLYQNYSQAPTEKYRICRCDRQADISPKHEYSTQFNNNNVTPPPNGMNFGKDEYENYETYYMGSVEDPETHQITMKYRTIPHGMCPNDPSFDRGIPIYENKYNLHQFIQNQKAHCGSCGREPDAGEDPGSNPVYDLVKTDIGVPPSCLPICVTHNEIGQLSCKIYNRKGCEFRLTDAREDQPCSERCKGGCHCKATKQLMEIQGELVIEQVSEAELGPRTG